MYSKTAFFLTFVLWGAFAVNVFPQHQISVCVIEEETGQPVQDAYVQVFTRGISQGVFLADNTLCSTPTSVQNQHQRVSSLPIGHPYPNPTGDIANVNISISSESEINYALYDVLGRQIEAGQTDHSVPNTHLKFNLVDKADGIYFAQIIAGEHTRTIKIVKQKGALFSLGATGVQQKPSSLNSNVTNLSHKILSDSTQIYVSVLTSDSLGVRIGSYFSSKTTHLIHNDTTLTISVAAIPEDNCRGEIFMIVEQMPQLIGGLESIQEIIAYPQEARDQGIEGRVFVQLIVDTQGRTTDGVIVRGIGGGINEEALRAVHLAEFHPGSQNGELKCVRMSLPITFRL